MPKYASKSYPKTYAMFVLSVLLLGVASAFVSARHITGYELSLFRYINSWSENLRWLFWGITFFGGVWMFLGVTLISLWQKRRVLALRFFVLGTTSFLLTELLKQLIGRPRPVGLLTDVHLREGLAPGYGFPSGHTAVATTISLILFPLLPAGWRWLCVIWILLVGLSRVYLGVHMPLDVVGGFAVGAIVISASLLLGHKLKFVTKITRQKSD